MADVESKAPSPLARRMQAIVERIQKLKPVRVFMHYSARRGPILAAGLSYQAIFSVFAALWAGFSVAGFVLGGNPELRDGPVRRHRRHRCPVSSTAATGGAIDPDDLLASSVLGLDRRRSPSSWLSSPPSAGWPRRATPCATSPSWRRRPRTSCCFASATSASRSPSASR